MSTGDNDFIWSGVLSDFGQRPTNNQLSIVFDDDSYMIVVG